MVLFFVAVLAGLVLLTFAADHFVIGATRLSVRLHVSKIVVGAVVLGFGTSAPEIFVSGIASAQGELAISVGNIIGSNVSNLTLVLGTAALITVLAIQVPVLRREAPLSTLSVFVFGVFVLDDRLGRVEGVVLLVLLVVSLALLIHWARDGDGMLEAEVDEFVDEEVSTGLSFEVARILAGLAGTVAGAWILIWGATGVADRLGLAQGFVGFSLVAVGTSLPELVTSVQAARKRESGLILGNLLGSNLFNSLAVGGIAALLGPGRVGDERLTHWGTAVMMGVAALVPFLMYTGRRVSRLEGVVLLVLYVATLSFLA